MAARGPEVSRRDRRCGRYCEHASYLNCLSVHCAGRPHRALHFTWDSASHLALNVDAAESPGWLLGEAGPSGWGLAAQTGHFMGTRPVGQGRAFLSTPEAARSFSYCWRKSLLKGLSQPRAGLGLEVSEVAEVFGVC